MTDTPTDRSDEPREGEDSLQEQARQEPDKKEGAQNPEGRGDELTEENEDAPGMGAMRPQPDEHPHQRQRLKEEANKGRASTSPD